MRLRNKKTRPAKVIGGITRQKYYRLNQKEFVTVLKELEFYKNYEND